MAPAKSKNSTRNKDKDNYYNNLLQEYNRKYFSLNFLKSLIFDPAQLGIVSIGILLAELVLNVVVVQNVPYTEIDWVAYMQECEGFLNGTTNYALLRGDTGPLVYPAGFVYFYSILYYITGHGQNIRLAQYIFIAIYLLQMYFVLRLYRKSRKLPPYVLVISAFTSYRIHSIYVLRLFNDPIAILFLYVAINMYMDGRWTLGSCFLSLGVSIKMNILLFAPAILLLYLTNLGLLKTVWQLFICGIIQLIMAIPFLLTHPIEYLRGSFDLGRVFDHKWTVNYRFLSKDLFEQHFFHIALLIIHLALLALFFKPCYQYMLNYVQLRQFQAQVQPQIDRENIERKLREKKGSQKAVAKEETEEELTEEQKQFLDSFEKSVLQQRKSGGGGAKSKPVPKSKKQPEPVAEETENYAIHFDKSTQLILLPIFLANFIGIVCARSLHYQFYVWYFHSLPYLVWFTEYNLSTKFLLLGLLEYAWNTYPSTDLSSAILHGCHFILLFGIGKHLFGSRKTAAAVLKKDLKP